MLRIGRSGCQGRQVRRKSEMLPLTDWLFPKWTQAVYNQAGNPKSTYAFDQREAFYGMNPTPPHHPESK
jgi:hypothetical protein